jgi:copper chaperone NosL
MTIMDEKFGAELMNEKGKTFKFDSDECMLHYLKENKALTFASYLVVNYHQPKELTDATKAFFVHGGDVESPMGGQLASFKNKTEAEKFKEEKKGELLTWPQLQSTDF